MKTHAHKKISVIIKALNEEKNIEATIESAITALSGACSEIILADSHSTDRTIELASKYPIKIVQLQDPAERCCGIGGQLGYQHASGEYLWIVDADMILNKDFLQTALLYLNKNEKIAGVGGVIVERNLESLEFRARVQRAKTSMQFGEVDRLDGGGLYLRAAIDRIGYFTNRNLHSYEEYELAVRLRADNWELLKIDMISASHYGHKTEAFQLLIKRWRSGYIFGIGELLRSAINNNYFKRILFEVKEVRIYLAVIFWWIALAITLASSLLSNKVDISVVLILLILPAIAIVTKKRSVGTGIYSLVSWNFYALGLIIGFVKKQAHPRMRVASRLIRDITQDES